MNSYIDILIHYELTNVIDAPTMTQTMCNTCQYVNASPQHAIHHTLIGTSNNVICDINCDMWRHCCMGQIECVFGNIHVCIMSL